LQAYDASWKASNLPQKIRLQEDHIQQLRQSGILERALKVGAAAPLWQLPDADGQTISLAELLEAGSVVLLWYRGGWSPHCVVQLRAYSEVWPQLRELKATLVAISPQTPENSLMTRELAQLDFPVLSDVGNRVARQYGLVYQMPPNLVAELIGADLREYNGDASNELPLAATYVIGPDGIICYAFLDADYRKRAEPTDVLAALREIPAPEFKPEPTEPGR